MPRILLSFFCCLWTLSVSAHPPGMVDERNLRCGKNLLTNEIVEVCLTDIFTGAHTDGEATVPTVILRFADGSDQALAVIRQEETSLFALAGPVDLQSVIKMARVLSFQLNKEGGVLRGIESQGDLKFRVAFK